MKCHIQCLETIAVVHLFFGVYLSDIIWTLFPKVRSQSYLSEKKKSKKEKLACQNSISRWSSVQGEVQFSWQCPIPHWQVIYGLRASWGPSKYVLFCLLPCIPPLHESSPPVKTIFCVAKGMFSHITANVLMKVLNTSDMTPVLTAKYAFCIIWPHMTTHNEVHPCLTPAVGGPSSCPAEQLLLLHSLFCSF